LRRVFTIFVTCSFAATSLAEYSGEAKISSRESMKKVEDGNPILEQNRQRHLTQAALYQAQMNFPKAADEMAKAQMLQQQIDQNNQSREKNSNRKDTAVEASDAAQSQLKMTALPGSSTGSAPVTPTSRATNNSAAPTESLVWTENSKATNAAPMTGSVSSLSEVKKAVAQIYDSGSDVADLSQMGQFQKTLPVPPPQYLAISENVPLTLPLDNGTPTQLDMTLVEPAPMPIAIAAPPEKDKLDDEFFKDKKKTVKKKAVSSKKKKATRKVASKKRAPAKKK
jgi:hypothetical protein